MHCRYIFSDIFQLFDKASSLTGPKRQAKALKSPCYKMKYWISHILKPSREGSSTSQDWDHCAVLRRFGLEDGHGGLSSSCSWSGSIESKEEGNKGSENRWRKGSAKNLFHFKEKRILLGKLQCKGEEQRKRIELTYESKGREGKWQIRAPWQRYAEGGFGKCQKLHLKQPVFQFHPQFWLLEWSQRRRRRQ